MGAVVGRAYVQEPDARALGARSLNISSPARKRRSWQRGGCSVRRVELPAIPRVFPPVWLDGKLLVDGGVSSLVPVEEAHGQGTDA